MVKAEGGREYHMGLTNEGHGIYLPWPLLM